MKNSISILILALLTTFFVSCSKSKKQEAKLKFTQDSIKIDGAFRSQIISLRKSIDSLLPYSERQQFKDTLYKNYYEMLLLEINERQKELNLPEEDYDYFLENDAFKKTDLYQTAKYQLEQKGYGKKYIEKTYNDWARMRSKNPIGQEYLEEKLADLEWKYQNFKKGIK